MINKIRNNTISKIDAKKDLNALNKIKNAEKIKYKKHTPGHKKLINLFKNLSNIILTDKTLELESQENENEKVENRNVENEDKDYENENYEDDDDDENNDVNETIKNLNNLLDEKIDKSNHLKIK